MQIKGAKELLCDVLCGSVSVWKSYSVSQLVLLLEILNN